MLLDKFSSIEDIYTDILRLSLVATFYFFIFFRSLSVCLCISDYLFRPKSPFFFLSSSLSLAVFGSFAIMPTIQTFTDHIFRILLSIIFLYIFSFFMWRIYYRIIFQLLFEKWFFALKISICILHHSTIIIENKLRWMFSFAYDLTTTKNGILKMP